MFFLKATPRLFCKDFADYVMLWFYQIKTVFSYITLLQNADRNIRQDYLYIQNLHSGNYTSLPDVRHDVQEYILPWPLCMFSPRQPASFQPTIFLADIE